MKSRKCIAIWLTAAWMLGFVLVAQAAPPSTNPGVGNPNPPGLANRPSQAANPIPPGLANRPSQAANPIPPGLANRPSQAANPIPPGLVDAPPPGVDMRPLELELLVGGPPPGPAQFEIEPAFEPGQSRVANSIPEPTSVALTTLGLIGVGIWRRRGRRAA